MTRVLALVTDAFGGRGGIAQAARDFIEALSTQEAIIAIDVLPRHVPDPVEDLPPKVRQCRAAPWKFGYAARAIAAATKASPNFVYCNHLFMAPLAAIVARVTGARLLIQLHGIEMWPTPTPAQLRALETADFLLCVSRDTRARVLVHADIAPERAIVLNNTVGPQYTPGDRAAARAKFGLEDEFVLLTVGRLDARERYKGHDRVIAALPGLEPLSGRTLTYLIAGDGDDRPRLETEVRDAGVSDRVRFLGQVPAEDLPDLYRVADLFVLPSTGEGFGIAFLEAMACGTPTLGLALGGAVDALGDGGLGHMVGPEDSFVEAIADAFVRPPPNPAALAVAVASRFGRAVFAERMNALVSRLDA